MPKREKKYVSIKKCKRTTVQYIIQNPIVLRQPPLWLVSTIRKEKLNVPWSPCNCQPQPPRKQEKHDSRREKTGTTTPSVQDTVDDFKGLDQKVMDP
jgi:hypothetical protein